ncbi:MAG: branched chain amino acid aminotransferase [Phycisphaeraceae bacterium]|nr:MAG: branched chain amino acid aminotransferase [Phycisphaeraceae bacterium]
MSQTVSQTTGGSGVSGGASAQPYNSQFAKPADSDRPLIWVNGQLVPKSQAMVSVYDHGLLYGDGVFEGIRVYNGKIFKSAQHMDRLYHCAEKIFLDIPISKEEMVAIQRQCIEANGITDGYIRLVVSRGEGTLGLNPYLCPTPGIVCIADTIALFAPEMYEKGMRVVLAERPKTPIACLDPRVKSLNYLNNILAKCEAIHLGRAMGIEKPEDQLLEVIMLNTEGKVAEGSGDNIFFIKDGKLVTPPSDAGILEGITRRFVMDTLCPDCGVEVEERYFTIDELHDADEAFLTGSAAEMIAVREILTHEGGKHTGTHRISDGQGPITAKLRARFREIVTSDHVPED